MTRKKMLTLSLSLGLFSAPFAAPLPFTTTVCSAAEQASQSTDRSIVLVGDLQTLGGAAAKWSPSDTATRMHDDGNGFYSFHSP